MITRREIELGIAHTGCLEANFRVVAAIHVSGWHTCLPEQHAEVEHFELIAGKEGVSDNQVRSTQCGEGPGRGVGEESWRARALEAK